MNVRKFTVILALAAITALAGTGCAPQTLSGASSESDSAELQLANFTWNAQSDCTVCHDLEAASLSQEGVPVEHASLSCNNCHDQEDILSNVHDGVTMEEHPSSQELLESEVSVEKCTACHRSFEDIAASHPETAIADENGTRVNPHAIQDLSEQHANITCSDCHKLHGDSSAEEAAIKRCYSCHHKQTFECGTCHEV